MLSQFINRFRQPRQSHPPIQPPQPAHYNPPPVSQSTPQYDQAYGDQYAHIDATPRRGLVPMRWQRIVYSFIITGAVSLYTNPAMWAHIDRIQHPYGFWLKGGLLGVIDVTLFFLVSWALNGRTYIHRLYSFAGGTVLTIAMIVHAGAVNRLEASHGEETQAVGALAEGLAKIGGAQAEGVAKGAGEAAIKANSVGQRKLAARLGDQAGKGASALEVQQQFLTEANKHKAESFLPNWYMAGAMYWALMVLAIILGAGGVFLSEDRNGDGAPDILQLGQSVQPQQPNYYGQNYGQNYTTSYQPPNRYPGQRPNP